MSPEVNRRTFVGASVAAGGAVVAGSLLVARESESLPAQGETSVVSAVFNATGKCVTNLPIRLAHLL